MIVSGVPGSTGWKGGLDDAADGFDWARVTAACQEYIGQLRATPEPARREDWQPVLKLLRENRRYEDLLAVADALPADDVDHPAVKRYIAQGLVDRGKPAAARLVFSVILDRNPSSDEAAQASGGLGRCAKELFLSVSEPLKRAGNLRESYPAYRRTFDSNPVRHHWHGINAAAPLARAAREARRLAEHVLAVVEDVAEPETWHFATACEACLALGRDEEAVNRARQLVKSRRATAFEIASLLRQLTQIWQLDTHSRPGDDLLALLRAGLLDRGGGDVAVLASGQRDSRPRRPAAALPFPDEPGSSGSPVFDNSWRLIGLHHQGSTTQAKLNGKTVSYEANEAILITAIRARLGELMPGPDAPVGTR